jgi:hypothetical protein
MPLSQEEREAAKLSKTRFLSDEEKNQALASKPKKIKNYIEPSDEENVSRYGIESELGELGANIGKLGARGIDAVFGSNLKSKVPDNLVSFTPEEQAIIDQHPNYFKGGKVAGAVAPMLMPLGIASKGASYVEKGIESYPKLAAMLGKKGTKTAAKIAGRSAEGAAIVPVYNPDDPLKAAGEGAIIGAASVPAEAALGYGLGMGAKYAGKGLKKIFGAHASPEEVERNMKAADIVGTSSSFGEVSGSPTLKMFESLSAHIPFSGNAGAYVKRGRDIQKSVADVVEDMRPKDVIDANGISNKMDVDEALQNALIKATRQAESTKSRLYKLVSGHADKTKEKVSMTNYEQAAKENIKQIEKFSKENKEFSDIYDPTLASKLKSITKNESNQSNILDKNGKQFETKVEKERSFGAAFDLDKRINAAIENADAKGDRSSESVLLSLKAALNKDIDQSALASDNKELVKNWIKAKEHFKNNVIPLRDKNIIKFTKKDERNERIIPTFLKGGQFEQPQLLEKLTRYLSPKEKTYVAHEYLTKGLREVYGQTEIKEGNILNAYKKMGDDTKKILFTPEQRMKLDSALIAKENTGLDLNQMVQPKTGEKMAKAALALGSLGIATGNVDQERGKEAAELIGTAKLLGLLSRNKKFQHGYLNRLKESEKPVKAVNLDGVSRYAYPFLSTDNQK